MLGDMAAVQGEFSEGDPLQGQYEALFTQGGEPQGAAGRVGEAAGVGVSDGTAASDGADGGADGAAAAAAEEDARSKVAASIFVDSYAIDGE